MIVFSTIHYHLVKEIFINLQKFKYYSLLAKLPVKIKRSEIFAVKIDMQKLSFWKLFTERNFCGKKYKIKDL